MFHTNDDDELTTYYTGDTGGDGHYDTNQSKKKCFNIIPSMFRKKSSKYKHNGEYDASGSFTKHYSFEVLNDDKLVASFPITESCLQISGSPISPRVKNFNLDMKVLVLSRKDNPYLSQQIERSNSMSADYDNDYTDTPSTPIMSIRRKSLHHCYYSPQKSVISDNIYDFRDNNANLHDKLIRSPPPNFPEKLSHFLFSENYIDQQLKDDYIGERET